MKMMFALTMLFVFAATSAFAHAGHVHTHMGTVTMLHSSTQFMMKTTDGKDLTIDTTPKTSWLHSDGHTATMSDLAVGVQPARFRSEEHTSELQSRENLVCRLLLEKKK